MTGTTNARTAMPTPSTLLVPPLPTEDEQFEDAPINQGLLSRKRKSIRDRAKDEENAKEWLRPYWLGSSLFLLLFAFWLLDSLKDPTFARLVDGNLDKHQPPAKLCSVATTLLLVCLMEYLANLRQREALAQTISSHQEILDPGGAWNRMPMETRKPPSRSSTLDDSVSIDIFNQIGIPYVIAFAILAYGIQGFEKDATESEGFDYWYIVAYILYATIESFGSLTVAAFWSFTNSTLNLDDAERYYGPIIAIAQLGAIGGRTLVAIDRWQTSQLLVVVSLIIILQMVLMKLYGRRFQPTSVLAAANNDDDELSLMTWQDNDATLTKPFWSGVYLIFQNHYVLLILGVSCLYEISMTCLDYQMKLLGYARFEASADNSRFHNEMSFSEFMGRYGQVVNIISLLFSSLVFPLLMRRFGLRITLRVFPTLLLVVTVIAYGALPGNLAVLFFSLAVLKAMTYSIHDPAKEILYIPTSNAVKFRAKFWIDVAGERISKAIGSGFNTYAGSVDRSLQIASLPSLLSAAGLWFVCYYVGRLFDRLLRTGKIVGLETSVDPATYKRIPQNERHPDDDKEPSEVEIHFGDGSSFSSLDATNSEYPIRAVGIHHDTPTGKIVEMPSIRI